MTRPYRLLALAPVVGIVGAPWFANRIEPRILGLPFLLAWIVGWVALTSVIMAYIRLRDGAD
jgi:hypothetical protein